jgi:hypothetical protein
MTAPLFVWLRAGVPVELPVTQLPPLVLSVETLAHMPRWRGAWRRPFSVAEHCVMASWLTPPEHALGALLHDFHEAVFGDMPSPVLKAQRAMLPPGTPHPHDVLCAGFDRLVEDRWHVQLDTPEIRRADLLCAVAESVALEVASINQARNHFGFDIWHDTLNAMNVDADAVLGRTRTPVQACTLWLDRLAQLKGAHP